ncbi:hypothetical protein QO200_15460 [Flavobacterium sp. Arc3]|uniref:hypothetical protein n=1 Tax=Flavobacterium sp. Arc3 TaxID=3046686 RepID=UPI00352D8E27
MNAADINTKDITVKAYEHTIKLTVKVHLLKEKENAIRTALYAPGVYNLEKELEVEY